MIRESFSRYFHTLRYVKPIQLAYQLKKRVFPTKHVRFKSDLSIRFPSADIETFLHREPNWIGNDRVRVFHTEYEMSEPEDWVDGNMPSLSLYHVHYFDDLVAENAVHEESFHRLLIGKWIAENEPSNSPGWDSYPISRRVVNWIKFALRGGELNKQALSSLADQVQHLSRSIEWHLLGNHVLANAKALIFAGLFFKGQVADQWYATGKRIWQSQLDEQFLSDGGHFERSPMYHALLLEDLLDVINVLRAFGRSVDLRWCELAEKMLYCLDATCHPDGQIALLNDAAMNVASHPCHLREYASRLGIAPPRLSMDGQIHLRSSGYIRQRIGRATAIIDVAAIGPDYIPGHAHADSLSFELALDDRRVIVDTGTSEYALGDFRRHERSTAAHNTIEVDGLDSSEVWSSFRVAKRARTRVVEIEDSRIIAEHDGYARLPSVGNHRREWRFGEESMELIDTVYGSGRHSVKIRFHMYPGVLIERTNSLELVMSNSGRELMTLIPDTKTQVSIENGYYAPEFGLRLENLCVVLVYEGDLPVTTKTRFKWE